MCRLYYDHRPRSHTLSSCQKLAASWARWLQFRSSGMSCLPVLPLLSPVLPGMRYRASQFTTLLLSFYIVENHIMIRSGRSTESNQNILEPLRLEARAWLLLLSGEPVEAIRMLLLSCTWESSVQFCEVFVDRSKLLLKQMVNIRVISVRTPTLLFEKC